MMSMADKVKTQRPIFYFANRHQKKLTKKTRQSQVEKGTQSSTGNLLAALEPVNIPMLHVFFCIPCVLMTD